MARETILARTFVELADNLVDDFDVVDLVTRLTDSCVDILDVAAAGLMLATPAGGLRVLASSSDTMRLLELFEEQSDEGPCPDCYRSGEAQLNCLLAEATDRWPGFAPKALEAGFVSVTALPMRLRGATIGALNMFRVDASEMGEADVLAAQALADVATIAVLQSEAAREAQRVNEQLTLALDTRIVIEQAKGVLAERADIDVSAAFDRLRAYARSHNLRLADVATSVVDGTLATALL